MAEICRGYSLGSGKQLLATNVSFHIDKPGFRGLVNVRIGDSFPSQKVDLYDVMSLKIKQPFT